MIKFARLNIPTNLNYQYLLIIQNLQKLMKKFLQRSLMWLVALVAMFAVSGNAWAQADLLGSNPTFNASGTLDGEYKVTYSVAQGSGLGFAQASTTALYVTKDGQNYGNVSTSVSGYDVTFTVSNSTASVDGKYQIVVPNNYFKTTVMEFFANSNTITINLTGATGGGTVDPDPEQPEQPSGQTLNVTFDFSKGFVAEQDGITCEANGRFNSTYGFYQVQANQHITFTAPYGYLITEMVLDDGNNGYYSAYTVSTGEYESVDNGDWIYYPGNWTGSDASVTFYSNGNNRMKIVAITLVEDPNAKAIFADFTSASPADDSTVEELGSIVLGLPAGVTLNPASGSGTIIVNGVEMGTKYSQSESGKLEVAVPYINEDGEYTIVIPRGLVTATDGSINPETTLHYTVASPWFTITKSMINPTPDDAITLARDAQGNVIEAFNAFRIRLDNGLAFATANGSPFQFSYRKDNVNTIVRDAKLYVYSDSPSTATINFASKAITTPGEYIFTIAPESLTTTDGRKNKEEFSWTYTVDQPKAPEFVGATPADGTTLNKSVKGEYKFQFTQPLATEFAALELQDVTITCPDGEVLGFNSWANAAPFEHLGTTTYFTLTLGDNFEQMFANHLKQDGQLTFNFPANCVTSAEGVKNAEAFSVSYTYVAPTFYTYDVVIEGLGVAPNATVTVGGKPYRNGDTINVAETQLTADDVTDYQFGSYRATLTITQPANGQNGAIIVSYTEVPTARVQSVSPAEGDFELDAHEDGLTSITVFMDGTWDASVYAGDGNPVPEGVSLVGPEGAVTINASYGFCMWKESNQININHTPYGLTTPGQYTLHIPAGLNTIEGNPNPEMNFTWTVKAASQFSFGYYDTEALGEGEGYDKKTLTGFKLFAPQGVTFTLNSAMKPVIQKVEYAEGEDYMGGEATYTDVPATWNVNTTDNTITITFNEPYTENGSYQFAIPEGCIVAADGRTNKEVSLSASVDPTEYIDIVSTTPESYAIVDGPFTSIVLNLGSELDPAKVTFGKTIEINNTEVPVTATLSGTKVTLTFDDTIIYYGTNDNNFFIPERFITTTDGAFSRSERMWNVQINAPKTPLELTGIQMGWGGEVVTTSGANVEQVGMLILQFAENIEVVEGADLTTITVIDSNGAPCPIYQGQGWTNGDNTFCEWVNPQMTAVGTYTLHVPAGLFVGTESGLTNAEISFELVIADINTFVPTTSIKDGETVDALNELVLTAPAGVTFDHFTEYPANFFIVNTPNQRDGDDGKIINQATVAEDGKTATLRLNNYKVNGEYTIIVPKGYLRSTTPNEGNAEIVLHVTVDHQVLDWDANDNGIVEVYDVDAAVNAALERSYHMGASDEEDPAFKAVDRNNDGKITIGEITKLIQVLNNNAQAAE